MGKLIYSMSSSLDGYVVDAEGRYDWSAPDEEVHAFFNDYTRDFGTYIYGRRMYQEMVYWETADQKEGEPDVVYDFARVWQAADKVVYSTTLDEVAGRNTTLQRHFDPDVVRRLKTDTERDITIEGPTIAQHAIRAGLIDEYHRFLWPVVVGGGIPYFPSGVHIDLELIEERCFPNGLIYLRYRAR